MLVKRRSVKQLYKSSRIFGFGGGHHKPYDWRDDPLANKNLEVDVRGIGWDPKSYVSPY